MVNYQNGKIYAIRSYQTDEVYIGSTTQPLCERLAGHRRDYRTYSKDNKKYISSYELVKYDDCYIELIENYPSNSKEELIRREGELIRSTEKCVNMRMEGRTSKEYYVDNKEVIAEKQKEWRADNKEIIAEKQKEWRADNKEVLAEKSKLWRVDNKEIIAEKSKLWRADNKEKLIEKSKEYYVQNKETINEKHKQYYNEHKDELADAYKEYYDENREKILEYQENYRNNNKDKIAQRDKKYREKNHEKLLQYDRDRYEGRKDSLNTRKKELITCECGYEIQRCSKIKHQRTQKHIKLMDEKKNNTVEEIIT